MLETTLALEWNVQTVKPRQAFPLVVGEFLELRLLILVLGKLGYEHEAAFIFLSA